MKRVDTASKSDPRAGRFVPDELAPDSYEGVNLAPTTLESLVTWDVSLHARRDQERVSSAAARIPASIQGAD